MRFLAVLLLTASSLHAAPPPDPKGVKFFEDKIRPVLVQQCYQCHSVDAQKAKKLRGGLFLDTRDGVRKGGDNGPLLDGLLLKALRHDGDTKMPPKSKLPDSVIADFEAWLKMGAPDPRDSTAAAVRTIDIEAGKRYWAFQPSGKSTPPTSSQRNPIDAFLDAKRQAAGLTANGPASREKLIRRVYFDLTGLPPSPQDVDAFLKDTGADAYERVVDRLLKSERFGERWARHWLDTVRFAESGGYEFDGMRGGAYHYRDFVIKSFNDDLPFNEFVRLQIAGDHLKPGDYQALSATGFVVAGPYPGQTTAKTLELIRYDHLDDMLSTLGTSMLGLSMGCARCHDHKYDPVPQQDYYRMLAAFARTDSTTVNLDLNAEASRKAKEEFDKVHTPLVAARDKFNRDELPARVQTWLTTAKTMPVAPWNDVDPIGAPAKPKTPQFSLVFNTHRKKIVALRLETESAPKALPTLTLTAASLDGKVKPAAVKMKLAPAFVQIGTRHVLLVELEGDVGHASGTVLTLTVNGLAPENLRVALTTTRPPKLDGPSTPQAVHELLTLLEELKALVNDGNRATILRWFRLIDEPTRRVQEAVEQSLLKEPKPKLTPVFAATANRGGDVHHLIRGEVDRKNGVAKPGFIQVLKNGAEERWLGAAPKDAPAPRVALANWITDTEQGAGHLLARVIVNRLWQHHFGKGIVATPNDFGTQGEPPTHPELLDWLAGELIRGGWKLKPIHKLIVTSAAYQQASDTNPVGIKLDPQNRLLWRRTPRRLEAEAIRDAVLAVSGTLDVTMYGAGTLEGNSPRRSVYLTVKRSQMVPLMQIFDAPESIQSIGERSTTTAATQALAMMNSPFVRQRAEKLALRVAPQMNGPIDEAYRIVLSRMPSPIERQRMESFIDKQRQSYAPSPKARDLAITDFCQVLLCLNEFVYID